MKRINVTQQNYRVLTALQNDEQLGRIVYTKWYSNNRADIYINENTTYRLVPRGFWQTTLEVFKEETSLLTVKSKFSGFTITKTIDTDRPYYFKSKGIFKKGYALMNYKNEMLFEITSNFSWKKMYPGFTIYCQDNFGNEDIEKLLIMLSVHFYRTVQNAAAASAAI